MVFTVTDPFVFFDSESGLLLNPNTTSHTFYLPRLMPNSEKINMFLNSTEDLKSGVMQVMAGSSVISIFLQGSLKAIWD
jgi:hypothetical protein